MATTITHSDGSFAPAVVDGYAARREARSIVHTFLSRSDPDVTLRPFGLRVGTLAFVFPSRAAAQTAYGILSTPQVLTLADADVPTVNMSFVVAGGELTIHLDDQTRSAWIVTVPFQEVAP